MRYSKKWNISRDSVIENVFYDCLKEMYQKAQPSVDIDKYLKQIESGEIADDTRPYIYQRHYLSDEESKYIFEKYCTAYNISSSWVPNLNLLLDDLKKGCTVEKYIPEQVDEDGFRHPGYRGYDKRAPLQERINDIIGDAAVAEKVTEEVFDYIENRRDFYIFDRESQQFSNSVFLGAMPTSDKAGVIEYWKNQGVEVDIVDRDPESFWYIDHGYTKKEIKEALDNEKY